MKDIWNHDQIVALLLKAGSCALDLFQNVESDLKPDQSLVTIADLKVEKMIRQNLESPADGHYVIGEESVGEKSSEYVNAALKEVSYIVDPIDGTANYVNGIELWGISIGCSVDSRLIHGAIYLPALGELFITQNKQVIFYKVNDGKLIGEGKILDKPIEKPEKKAIISVTQKVAKGGKYTGTSNICCLGVAVYSLLNVLRGRYNAYIGKLKLWDIAGAIPMCERLGIRSILSNGQEVGPLISGHSYYLDPEGKRPFGLKKELFFCHADAYERLVDQLKF